MVKIGNDGSSSIIGISDILFETNNGNHLALKEIRYIPDVMLNLLSTRKLDDESIHASLWMVGGSSQKEL